MSRSLLLLVLTVSLIGCPQTPDDDDSSVDPDPVDADGDGHDEDADCDDSDPAIHPGADEVCDGVDNDCDEVVDGDAAVDAPTWYADGDGDGYGDSDATQVACDPPPDHVAQGGDCDDADPAYHPGAEEADCTDPADYNCDGSTGYADEDGDGFAACDECDDGAADINPDADEFCDAVDHDCDGHDTVGAVDAATWYADADGDGFGNGALPLDGCEQPVGHVDNADDCDDLDPTSFPGAAEVCDGADNDCDGALGADEVDTDADGFMACDDCDDSDPAYHPGAEEADCTDPADYNCDGSTGYADEDGDGFAACDECDDGAADINPDADEFCDAVDHDCDGHDTVGAVDAATWYADADGDGFGNGALPLDGCEQPVGHVDNADDCDDLDPTSFPGAAEVCDGADNDCDGALGADEADVDADGFLACDDCDDNDPTAFPGGVEICDGADDDCDGQVDEGATDLTTFWADADGDGAGSPAFDLDACEAPTGYVDNADDCDDLDATAFPGNPEACDGVDNDCDGNLPLDEADADTDGFLACDDCDDADPTSFPGNVETCDGADNDCDGVVDDGADTALPFWLDADADGAGNPAFSVLACAAPTGYVDNADDCDDLDDTAFPGNTEVCDGVDNDCDGSVGADEQDLDLDGFIGCDDCDDAAPDNFPGNDETCDGFDQDCDGFTDNDAIDADTWFGDADGDGYGGTTFTVLACDAAPTGYADNAEDCDDLDGDVFPGAPELCDDLDNDCDGALSDEELDDDLDGVTECDGDCDDADDQAFPGNPEICDGVDNDCDGFADVGALGDGPDCAGVDCADVLAERPGVPDGAYWIDPEASGVPFEVYCEMTFEGGGWVAVYNLNELPGNNASAAIMHASLINNAPVGVVLPDSDSASIYTSDLPLAAFEEVLYGWAPSTVDDVTRWGTYSDAGGLVGHNYIDGYGGPSTAIGTMDIEPTGSQRALVTGNSPGYPHVGIGFSGQIITWGYDNNASAYGHWANWYDLNPCCQSGNTAEVLTSGWRYVIYLR